MCLRRVGPSAPCPDAPPEVHAAPPPPAPDKDTDATGGPQDRGLPVVRPTRTTPQSTGPQAQPARPPPRGLGPEGGCPARLDSAPRRRPTCPATRPGVTGRRCRPRLPPAQASSTEASVSYRSTSTVQLKSPIKDHSLTFVRYDSLCPSPSLSLFSLARAHRVGCPAGVAGKGKEGPRLLSDLPARRAGAQVSPVPPAARRSVGDSHDTTPPPDHTDSDERRPPPARVEPAQERATHEPQGRPRSRSPAPQWLTRHP